MTVDNAPLPSARHVALLLHLIRENVGKRHSVKKTVRANGGDMDRT